MLGVRGSFAASICLGLVGAATAQAQNDKPVIDEDKIVGSWILVKEECEFKLIEFLPCNECRGQDLNLHSLDGNQALNVT
jgi:hypothetical protein